MPPSAAFDYQPQETGLNPTGQKALTDLLNNHGIAASRTGLEDRLRAAQKKLTEVAGDLNDTASERKSAFQKKSERLQANGDEIDDDERNHHEEFQQKVSNLTKKIDQSVRNVIDISVWHHNVPDAVEHAAHKASEVAQQTRRNRERQRDDEAGDDLMDLEEDEVLPIQSNPSQTPSTLLQEALTKQQRVWNAKSLTQRYSRNNDYVGFYKTVFDAKNPGEDAPPLPHADFWFAEEEGRGGSVPQPHGARAHSGEDDRDDDLEVASERIRTSCPITFRPFEEPWKSTKCPHSFEKNAIFQMIRESTRYLPWTPQQERELSQIRERRVRAQKEKEIGTPQVQCPECNVMLTEADLEPNPILLRKVKRILERERKEKQAAEEEESSDDEEAPRGTQRRPVGLGSSPPRRINAATVKNERARASVIPGTQISGESQTNRSRGDTTIEPGENEDEDMIDD